MIDLFRRCRRHRSALLDFVAGVEPRDGTPAALAHLDRCDRCRSEMETTWLAVSALRRLGDEAATAEPPALAWPRLRTRVERWRPYRVPVMSPLAGMAMSVGIVVALVGGFAGLPGDTSQPEGAARASELIRNQELVEEAWLRDRVRPELRPAVVPVPSPVVRASRPSDRLGPDGLSVTVDRTQERQIAAR